MTVKDNVVAVSKGTLDLHFLEGHVEPGASVSLTDREQKPPRETLPFG
jgi:hypothetical protein